MSWSWTLLWPRCGPGSSAEVNGAGGWDQRSSVFPLPVLIITACLACPLAYCSANPKLLRALEPFFWMADRELLLGLVGACCIRRILLSGPCRRAPVLHLRPSLTTSISSLGSWGPSVSQAAWGTSGHSLAQQSPTVPTRLRRRHVHTHHTQKTPPTQWTEPRCSLTSPVFPSSCTCSCPFPPGRGASESAVFIFQPYSQ